MAIIRPRQRRNRLVCATCRNSFCHHCCARAARRIPAGRTPIFWRPPSGKYTVLGARIDVNKAIYVLVDSGKGDPVYYVLPYSNQTAEQLQKAMEGARESGGRVGMQINGDGAIGIAENVPPEEP